MQFYERVIDLIESVTGFDNRLLTEVELLRPDHFPRGAANGDQSPGAAETNSGKRHRLQVAAVAAHQDTVNEGHLAILHECGIRVILNEVIALRWLRCP